VIGQPDSICNETKTASQSLCGGDSAVGVDTSVSRKQVKSAMRVNLETKCILRLRAKNILRLEDERLLFHVSKCGTNPLSYLLPVPIRSKLPEHK
jgi:hypothetical protein